jgi:hypothetical protein
VVARSSRDGQYASRYAVRLMEKAPIEGARSSRSNGFEEIP